jgi:mono/diheme cytochrome c family protein
MKQCTMKPRQRTMKQMITLATLIMPFLAGCTGHVAQVSQSSSPVAKAYGSQIVEVSGGKQEASEGSELSQPVVVQVNDARGNPISGALVSFHGNALQFNPAQALSDSSGQVSTVVQLGAEAGAYQAVAEIATRDGKVVALTLRETALGYQETVGKVIAERHCIRCHDRESTPERVSNFDNLSPAPHQLADAAGLSGMADADLVNLIAHGGPALKKSPLMPAYGATLKAAEIKAVVSYLRAIEDAASSSQVSKVQDGR